MSFTVKSLGCTAGRQLASRLSSSTHAGVGCEAIAGGGRTHAVAGETHLGSKSFLACCSGGFHHTLSRAGSWGTPGPSPRVHSPASRCLLSLPSSHRPAEGPQAAGSVHLPPGASGSHAARSWNRCARCSSLLLPSSFSARRG